ncbi:MAG: L,D-transpeptidase [Gemmatimonadaceae bacterium]
MRKLALVFHDNARIAWALIALSVAALLGSSVLVLDAADARYQRDIHRIGFNDNWDLLDEVKKQVGMSSDSLKLALEASPAPPTDRPYLVVSIEDRRVWYKQGDQVLFTTQVAVGSGKTLVQSGGGGSREEWKFETPRGRLVVQNKEMEPVWVPPDWHFVELAKKKGLGLVRLSRGQSVPAADGAAITVVGNDVVRKYPDGRTDPFDVEEGREIVVGGNMVVPPFGTNQRKYLGVLGTHRLNLGDGYALHGTDKPQSIGQAVSHGCVRLRNEDIAYLYSVVPVGTPVFIY